MGDDFADSASIAEFKMRQALAAMVPARFQAPIDLPTPVAEWVNQGSHAGGLYLTGPVGTGKTHLAFAALVAWCRTTGVVPTPAKDRDWEGYRYGPTVHPVRATTLLDQLRPGASDARQVVVDCQACKLLLIDDLGAEKPSEWTQERLYEVIDERYVHCLPLIITSNLPPHALTDQVGERTTSRLAEMCEVYPLTGPDRRMS